VRGAKKGEGIGRGNERGLFDDCQRGFTVEVYTSDFKAEQELQDTQTFNDLSAKRSRRQRQRPCREIDVPAGEMHSYAEELMTFAAKKPIPHDWGTVLFGNRLHYSERSLLKPAQVDRTPLG